jgi:hypothetical protein
MKLFTSDGMELMEVDRLKTAQGKLVIVGTIMGAMPTEAVLTPAELRKALKLLSFGILFFVIGMFFRK